jgi:pimeloyl-ACP methyl ester carboxylesterase
MLLLAPGLRWLSGGLSEGELERWREAGALPVLHPAFSKDIPVRYDLQIDGLGYLEVVPPPSPITIIHGRNDAVVPTDDSRQYAAGFPQQVQLVEVDAEHDLNAHLDLIWEYVESFLLDT